MQLEHSFITATLLTLVPLSLNVLRESLRVPEKKLFWSFSFAHEVFFGNILADRAQPPTPLADKVC